MNNLIIQQQYQCVCYVKTIKQCNPYMSAAVHSQCVFINNNTADRDWAAIILNLCS